MPSKIKVRHPVVNGPVAKLAKGEKIFISSSEHDRELAALFVKLLNAWGYRAYSYQKDIWLGVAGRPFMDVLQKELGEAKAVIFLVSREVKWSQYCQAELGATLFLNTPRILIPIPPIQRSEAAEIVRVFQTYNFYMMGDAFCARRFSESLDEAMGQDRKYDEYHDLAKPIEDKINEELKRIRENNALEPQDRELVKIWPSIDRKCRESQTSIVKHIVRSLQNEKQIESSLVLVGVSLKFSLELVSRALKIVADEAPRPPVDRGSGGPRKSLQIKIVHMSANSHILRALNDELDIGLIRQNFEKDWHCMLQEWRGYCAKAGIDFQDPRPIAIDYIPPQLGIMVDDVLFAGQCSFDEVVGRYQLRVGEGEYFYHTNKNDDARGQDAIRRFEVAVKAYSTPAHNAGIVLVGDTLEWDTHLKPAIENSENLEITFISQTQTRFTKTKLIQKALAKGHHLNVFIRDPASTDDSNIKQQIEVSLRDIRKSLAVAGNADDKPITETFFNHEPSYRAVIVGDKLLGFEPYVHDKSLIEPDKSELEPSHVRFVVLGNSPHFAMIRQMLLRSIEVTPPEKSSASELN